MSLSKHAYPVLTLNADHQVLAVWPWQDAVKARFRNSVYVVSVYEKKISSQSLTINLPSIVALRQYVNPRMLAAFTRRNVYNAYAEFRDGRRMWRCALCGHEIEQADLTFEHLLPRAQGGQSCWENVCLAHADCNNKKGNRTLKQAGLTLKIKILAPTESQLVLAKIRHDFDGVEEGLPPEWHGYIGTMFGEPGYWDATLIP